MCTHSPKSNPGQDGRHGSTPAHGDAHAQDHQRWSRRDFLSLLASAATGTALSLAGLPMQAFGRGPIWTGGSAETDRVLVLVELNGGNDGLNTVVPVRNDLYYNKRPRLALPPAQTLRIQDEVGLNAGLQATRDRWNEGQVAIVHNVGYPSPNLSHFRSMDIWHSASDAEVVDTTGWIGRYLHVQQALDGPPPGDVPVAVSIRGAQLPFQGPLANMGMRIDSLEALERLIATGGVYNPDEAPNTLSGHELRFLRQLSNESNRFGRAMQAAVEHAGNAVPYPAPPAGVPTASARVQLEEQLAIVARFIKGGLGARIYMVTLPGFDTHAGQAEVHNALLRYVDATVAAFYADLGVGGFDQQVLTMTFSEFGRRPDENGSAGTDHGAAAPLFVYGPAVQGGHYGTLPNLADLDPDGNLKHTFDFRTVYTTMLVDWLGFDADAIPEVFGRPYDTLGFVDPALRFHAKETTVGTAQEVPTSFGLAQNYPNPFGAGSPTQIGFHLNHPMPVRLRVFDTHGRHLHTLLDGPLPAGPHRIAFAAGTLPSGTYLYRLDTPDGTQSRHMTLVR